MKVTVKSALALMIAIWLIGCGRQAPTAATRDLSGVGPDDPLSPTECAANPCWCADPTPGYERVNQSSANFPIGYPGDGPDTLYIVRMPSGSPIHVWPAGICGAMIAESLPTTGCWICLNDSRVSEPEVTARTLSRWGASTFFARRAGKDYYFWQHGTVAPILVPSTLDTIFGDDVQPI